MHPNPQSPYEQSGGGRRRRQDPADDFDSFAPYPSDPGDSYADATQLYSPVPAATPHHTRVLPAMASHSDPGYPGQQPPPPGPGQYFAAPPAPPAPGQPGSRTYGKNARRVAADLKVSLGNALVGAGGLLMFLFSFGPFVRYDDPKLLEHVAKRDLPAWFSAWSLETLLAPLSWWVVFAGVGLLGIVGMRLKGTPADRELQGFRLGQIQVGLSLFSLLVLLGYALSAKTLVFGSELRVQARDQFMDGAMSFGWGGYLMLIGAMMAVAGSFLDHRGAGPMLWPRPARPERRQTPQGYQPPGSPYGQPGPMHPPAGYPPVNHPDPYQQQNGGYRL